MATRTTIAQEIIDLVSKAQRSPLRGLVRGAALLFAVNQSDTGKKIVYATAACAAPLTFAGYQGMKFLLTHKTTVTYDHYSRHGQVDLWIRPFHNDSQ